MYLGKTIDTDMFTIARAETKQFTISKWPRGTTRLVVIVDPSLGASVLVSWTAGSVSSPAPVNCGGDPNNQAPCTFTFDVVP
jgi:hypothetical protein